jgi:hypothetical protein
MRECGTCSACCRWPEIEEIHKPRGVKCGFLEECGYGCQVYGRRPRQCSSYKCAWLQGAGRDADRPDTSGVLIDGRKTPAGNVLVARDLGGRWGRKRKAIANISKDLNLACLLVADDDPERVLALVKKRPEMEKVVG